MLGASLAFPDWGTEQAFQRATIRRSRDLHLCCRAAGLLRWALLVASAYREPCALLGLACALLGTVVACRMSRMTTRTLYPLEAAVDLLQPLCACSLFHAIHPAAAGASAGRALACLVAGNGVAALAALLATSPLTLRWRLPVLAAGCATLLAHAPSFGRSPLLQHGYGMLLTLVRVLLPLLAPAFVELSPPGGAAALLDPVPDPALLPPGAADARAAATAACQAIAVLAGCAALGTALRRGELRRRKQFAVAEAVRRSLEERPRPRLAWPGATVQLPLLNRLRWQLAGHA